MKVEFTKDFTKTFKKRFTNRPSIQNRLEERVRLFINNSTSPMLKDHALGGKMEGFRSFSVTGDVRVIYYIYEDIAYFVDIGTHNQVY